LFRILYKIRLTQIAKANQIKEMMSTSKFIFSLLVFAVVFTSCSTPGADNPGSEFMPDMGHSVAYEANVYTDYDYNVWDNSVADKKKLATPGLPVEGTIPRGYAGGHSKIAMNHLNGSATTNAISVPVNGSVPYYYADNEEERARAVAEILSNPFPITEAGLAKGKMLYDIQCGICHGKKGDGNGWLVDEANLNAKYPAAPANFLQDTFYNSTNGRFYHAIIYGKNVMGGYADKASYEERWQIIHYIHSLMAKEKKFEYSETGNTMTNNNYDRPGAMVKQVAEKTSHGGDHGQAHDADGHGHGGENGDDGHGHEEGGNHSGHDHEGDHH